jgi:hypothetical protein
MIKTLEIADQIQLLRMDAANELRRLHALNAELVEALELSDAALSGANMNMDLLYKRNKEVIDKSKKRIVQIPVIPII